MEKEDANAPIIHTLTEDDFEEEAPVIENELIITTESIKNINVIYDEVLDAKPVTEEDFIITPIQQTEVELVDQEKEEEQITLTFDLPLSQFEGEKIEEPETGDEKMLFHLEEEVKDITVSEPIELISVDVLNEEGEKRYVLDDISLKLRHLLRLRKKWKSKKRLFSKRRLYRLKKLKKKYMLRLIR